jgi:hypothetical protein
MCSFGMDAHSAFASFGVESARGETSVVEENELSRVRTEAGTGFLPIRCPCT